MSSKRQPIAADNGLAALVRRYGLGDRAAQQLGKLLGLLIDDPLAPTGISDRRRAVDDHLADALVALVLEQVRSAIEVVDLGAGAGLPGLPLAIACPGASFSLVESAAKKGAFIERAVRTCAIGNAQVVNARAEAWAEGRCRFDLALARAVAPLDVVVEYAAPLLVVGGTLVAWRGQRQLEAEGRAAHAAELIGMERREILRVAPYREATDRHLHLFSKVMETPPEFPRRAGVAVKRPLGARRAPTGSV